jgi:hypothetical protein
MSGLRNVVMLAVYSLTAVSIPAQACSCANLCKPESECIKQEFKYAAAVFVGTPVEVVAQPYELPLGPDHKIETVNYHVRFVVKGRFKGISSSTAESNNGSGGGDCSYGRMDVGRDYLIYAQSVSPPSVVSIHGCSRTRPFPDDKWSKSEKKHQRKELSQLKKLSRTR